MATIIGLCTIEFELPGMTSIKDKRRILKSMLSRLHNTFNISASEVDQHDIWQAAVIAFATVTTSTQHANQTISIVLNWIEKHYPDALIIDQHIEIL